ncbi:hypothetical protein MMC07_001605 [Pseudocyphellaria aurata]|nr:hypothetical protein [Pseudocyphellaria aurata]
MSNQSTDNGVKRKSNTDSFSPISFDRVIGGRPRSNSLLFKLPVEILGLILEHVDSTSLPSLALVNSDSRQWARSRQFASVVLLCNHASIHLIELLREEHQEIKARGSTLLPSLGVCIRYIKVVVDNEGRDLRRKREIRLVNGSYGSIYFQFMQEALCSRQLLPHLQKLDVEGVEFLPQSFFKNLTQSAIQHLKLNVMGDEDFTIELSDAVSTSWPLRTLDLELMGTVNDSNGGALPQSTRMLRLCASTLESFRWDDLRPKSERAPRCLKTALDPVPCFTRLRNLYLRNLNFPRYSMLDAFLHHDSSRLGVRTQIGPEYANFFHTRGWIPSLRVFRFGNSLTRQFFRFLRVNTHLTSLLLTGSHPTDVLETQLLPLLSKSFSRLTSLGLIWAEVVIPEAALGMIGSIRSLQFLYLSAGTPSSLTYRVSPNFQIDHNAIRRHLPELKALKTLAFTFDTYSNKRAGPPVNTYYQDMFFHQRDSPTYSEERRKVWEQMHRTRMLAEASEYALLMPQLEYLFLGQIPVGFKEVPRTAEHADTVRVPVALATQRNLWGADILSEHFSDFM